MPPLTLEQMVYKAMSSRMGSTVYSDEDAGGWALNVAHALQTLHAQQKVYGNLTLGKAYFSSSDPSKASVLLEGPQPASSPCRPLRSSAGGSGRHKKSGGWERFDDSPSAGVIMSEGAAYFAWEGERLGSQGGTLHPSQQEQEQQQGQQEQETLSHGWVAWGQQGLGPSAAQRAAGALNWESTSDGSGTPASGHITHAACGLFEGGTATSSYSLLSGGQPAVVSGSGSALPATAAAGGSGSRPGSSRAATERKDSAFELEKETLGGTGKKEVCLVVQGDAGIAATLGHIAPEVFLGSSPCTAKSDVFGFGVILYALFHRKIPIIHHMIFNVFPSIEAYAASVAGGYRPPLAWEVPHEIRTLIERCWAQRPEERPSIAEVARELEQVMSTHVLGPRKPSSYLKFKQKLASASRKRSRPPYCCMM